ncbi:hypothetical protein GCM10020221_25560 [Streptomyces thioluteus]|uniref:Uncharacterized protein n=1 Tax=Streptomyces thioluteus TaxID=66431 RepID=A0ABN3WUQ7_STRTU
MEPAAGPGPGHEDGTRAAVRAQGGRPPASSALRAACAHAGAGFGRAAQEAVDVRAGQGVGVVQQ